MTKVLTTDKTQIKKWILPKPIHKDELYNCQINYTLQKILYRRGIYLEDELKEFLSPKSLPNPINHFDQLDKASQRIIDACHSNEKIAICGDYDADGITSTVLLVELLTKLGAQAIPYIPSRQEDGYGLNKKIIEDIGNKDIKLAITVDNGISAFEAIERSQDLGIDLIITDHHKIPEKKLEFFALIHPERSPNNSPYKSLAGVGIAYMLSKNICNILEYNIDKTTANELFCIGTVADMAPLTGANRVWIKECLPKIKSTNNLGIKKILRKLALYDTNISTEDIGFKIAPLINAVGRIGEPNLIIDLLTNTNESIINKLTKECFSLHIERKKITELVLRDAMEIALTEYNNNKRFIVIHKREWHPGIIGIVAARIVDKFNLPTAILSIANDGIYRGSIRSNNKLKVNLALDECEDILLSHGGHSAAAGFTIREENIPKLKDKLNDIAIREMDDSNLSKSINPDAHISFIDINLDFYRQLMLIGPFGISNKAPIFWTRKCRIVDIYNLKGNHIKLILDDGTGFIDAIKWNSFTKLQINDHIDVAFYIEINKWKNQNKLQLNIIDFKKYSNIIEIQIHNRIYKCQLTDNKNIKITNQEGKTIRSNESIYTKSKNIKHEQFARKIISFAEIALGKAA